MHSARYRSPLKQASRPRQGAARSCHGGNDTGSGRAGPSTHMFRSTGRHAVPSGAFTGLRPREKPSRSTGAPSTRPDRTNRYSRASRNSMTPMSEPDALCLDLLKQCLLGSVCGANHTQGPCGARASSSAGCPSPGFEAQTARSRTRHAAARAVRGGPGEPEALLTHGETMVGRKRLDNVHACVEDVLAKGVEGDLIEAGVWRGGVADPDARELAARRRHRSRAVWAADSFAGLPLPVNADVLPARAIRRTHTGVTSQCRLGRGSRQLRALRAPRRPGRVPGGLVQRDAADAG